MILKDSCNNEPIVHLAPLWNQPKCPSRDELIKQMRYIYKIKYYSAIKKNEIISFAGGMMYLEIIKLSEISQKEKNKYHVSYDMWNL